MRLIDAEALKKAFEDCTGDCACCIHNTNDFEYCGLIDDAPTVPLPDFKEGYKQAIIDGKTNFSRPKGEWIDTGDMAEYWAEEYQCSICGKKDHWNNFCPNCGADMRGKKKETTFDDYLEEQLKDPEFRKEWKKLSDEEQKGGEEE